MESFRTLGQTAVKLAWPFNGGQPISFELRLHKSGSPKNLVLSEDLAFGICYFCSDSREFEKGFLQIERIAALNHPIYKCYSQYCPRTTVGRVFSISGNVLLFIIPLLYYFILFITISIIPL